MSSQAGFRRSPYLRLLYAWGPVVGWALAIFIASSISNPPGLPGGVGDKTAHALVYLGLGALAARAFAGGRISAVDRHAFLRAVLLSAVYGLTDEVHQLFVGGRQFEGGDLAADTVGALVGAGALWAWSIMRGRSGA